MWSAHGVTEPCIDFLPPFILISLQRERYHLHWEGEKLRLRETKPKGIKRHRQVCTQASDTEPELCHGLAGLPGKLGRIQ